MAVLCFQRNDRVRASKRPRVQIMSQSVRPLKGRSHTTSIGILVDWEDYALENSFSVIYYVSIASNCEAVGGKRDDDKIELRLCHNFKELTRLC